MEQTGEGMVALTASLEQMEARLEAAAQLVERTIARLDEREGEVRKMVAAVESGSSREEELERRLQAAEQQIADLRAQTATAAAKPAASARKTVPAATVQFLAKQGLSTLESLEAGALDAALDGLSLEQRISVKAQLLRAGVLG